MLYCVEVEREMEEKCVLHYHLDHEPTREEILEKILNEDLGYDDDYGRFEFYQVD